jgi:hypothetical protein
MTASLQLQSKSLALFFINNNTTTGNIEVVNNTVIFHFKINNLFLNSGFMKKLIHFSLLVLGVSCFPKAGAQTYSCGSATGDPVALPGKKFLLVRFFFLF